MKKIAFLIWGLTFSLASFGQNKISLSNAASVDLPPGMQKIEKQDALSFAARQFNNEPIIMRSIARRSMEHIFRDKNVLVSLHYESGSSPEDHLAQMKKGFDEWHYRDSTYSAKLEKINGNSDLVINYIIGNVGLYRFFLFNANNNKVVTGILEFNKIDKNEATLVLNHILKTVSLKD